MIGPSLMSKHLLFVNLVSGKLLHRTIFISDIKVDVILIETKFINYKCLHMKSNGALCRFATGAVRAPPVLLDLAPLDIFVSAGGRPSPREPLATPGLLLLYYSRA